MHETTLSGVILRQSSSTGAGSPDTAQQTPASPPAPGPINPARLAAAERKSAAALLGAKDAAAVLGIGERAFHMLRDQPWMPKPVTFGPRLLRWSRAELEAAVASMPRAAAKGTEHPNLAAARRRKIEALKGAA